MGDYNKDEWIEMEDDTFEKWRKDFEERHPFYHWFNSLFKEGSIAGYSPHVIFSDPIKIIEQVSTNIKHGFQRMFRGWDDTVPWGINYYLSKVMPLWIEELIENNQTVAFDFFDFDDIDLKDFDGAGRRQSETHQKIADGFREVYNLDMMKYKHGSDEWNDAETQVEDALKLFVKYFHTLND